MDTLDAGQKSESDPVHTEDGRWYFWDETWSDRHGPYETEAVARYHLSEYSRIELEGKMDAAEFIAYRFHEMYETLAPKFNYQTRPASAKPWFEVPEQNKKLMIAVAQKLLEEGVIALMKRR